MALLAVGVAACFLPAAQATPVTLFAHVPGPTTDFPMNTQEPPADFAVDAGVGTATNTLTCLPSQPVADTSQGYHTLYGYSVPSLVEYEFEVGGHRRVHPERGLAADVNVDPAVPMLLHWYLSEPRPGEAGAPLPVPNVVVEATMRAGESISVDDAAYNAGPVLAHGRSTAALLAGELSQGVEWETVDGRPVYHFVVPLTVDEPVIPRATGFNLRVDVLVDNPACDEGAIMPNAVLLHTSPGHRPRLEFGASDVLRLGYIHPQFVGEDFVVHTSVLDVWGVYDLDATSLGASIAGPGMPPTALQRMDVVYEGSEHRRFSNALELVWMLPGVGSLPYGNYTITHTASTRQGETGTWQASFELGEPQEAPSLPATALPLALALAALAHRRP